jgi:hypothetical protein
VKGAPSPVLLSALAAAALGLAACAAQAMSTASRDAMVKDYNCPADQVTVEDLGDSKFRASGCGKTQVYTCKVPGYTVVACVPLPSGQPLPDSPR